MRAIFLALVLVVVSVNAQGQGTLTPEVHPTLAVQQCTSQGSCSSVSSASIVLDSNWRWVHDNSGYDNCYTGNTWSSQYCPDPTTCVANCVLEGLSVSDYQSTYGITTSGSTLQLGFVTTSDGNTNVGSRVYLMNSDSTYQILKLKGQELAVDVDVSQLPCGLNGAMYLVEMSADGGMSAYSGNKAGAQYGTGYCDAQCPQDLKFINGQANIIDWTPSGTNTGTGSYGSCCNELDIWEANSVSAAYTPHNCNITGQTRCTGSVCGGGSDRYDGYCDKDGCDLNSYRMGNTTFYGNGKTIDTSKVITVVTQFITADGTANTDLVEIRRYYSQNGNVIPNAASTFSSMKGANSITDEFCNDQKTLFGDQNIYEAKGGMTAMGKAMDRGLVLTFSLWDDDIASCLWLDSTYPASGNAATPGIARGTCPTTNQDPASVEAAYPSSYVKFSNVKWGALGSTTQGVPAPASYVSSSASSGSGSSPAAASSGSSSGTTYGSSSGSSTSEASSSSSGSGSCEIGAQGCACTTGGACDKGLSCLSKICVDASGLQANSAHIAQLSAMTIAVVLGAALLL